MKHISRFLGIVALVQLITADSSAAPKDNYLITVPNTLRPNEVCTVSFTYIPTASGAGQILKVDIEISKINDVDPLNDDPITVTIPEKPPTTTPAEPVIKPVTASATVKSGQTTLVKLKIPDWPSGTYVIKVTGTIGDKKFDRRASINLNVKTSTVFIQTDKSIFQAGQNVQYRCYVVDSNLRPQKDVPVQVTITDASQNIIRLKNYTTNAFGLLQDSLPLSVKPVFGYWSIQCTTLVPDLKEKSNPTKSKTKRAVRRPRPPKRRPQGGESAYAQFEVKEYVLQKFDVRLTPPDYIVRSATEFVVIVDAQYTFNKGVPGVLILNVTDTQCTYNSKCGSHPVTVKITDFTGNYKATIKMGELSLPKNVYSISMSAIVTEKDTGISRSDTQTSTVYETDETLTITQPSSLRPGIPHEVSINLVKPNGRPVTTAEGKKVKASYTMNLGDYLLVDLKFDKTGVAKLTINALPDSSSLSVHAAYNGLSAYGSATVAQSLSEKYLSLEVKTKLPKVGDNVILEVKTSVEFSGKLTLQVVGRGKILSSKTSDAKSGPNTTVELKTKATIDMAPHAKFVVFFLADCGEVVGNVIDVDIDGALQTELTITASNGNQTVKPGDNITVTLKTNHPDTLALLVGVDRSIKLMSTPNDITKETIYNALSGYDIGNPPYYDFFRPGFIRRPDWGSLDQIFTYAGLIMFTSGLYSKGSTCRRYGPVFFGGGMAMSKSAVMEDDFEVSSPAPRQNGQDAPRVREFFPETFIWGDYLLGENQTTIVTYKVPDTVTTYEITGVGVNKKFGLGVVDSATNVTIIQPFFISLNFPVAIIQGEIFDLQVVIFNYLGQDEVATVTLLNTTNNEFKIVEQTDSPSITKRAANPPTATKTVKVPKDSLASVHFRLQAEAAGLITIGVKATVPKAGDQVIQTLLVKPEGTTQFFNKAMLIKVDDNIKYNNTAEIVFPLDDVRGSEFAEVTAIGDIMWLVINNIQNLIRIPYGCGEQNMVTFVPDIMALRYLINSKAIKPEQEANLRYYINVGYQTQLLYKRYDGSYSAFGNSDKYGATWLTALVVKAYSLAKLFTDISDDAILSAKRFLQGTQNATTGEFVEKGRLLNTALQGGSGTGYAITAFVLIAFLETKDQFDNSEFQANIDLAKKLLEKELTSITSVYELAIVCYALHLTDTSDNNKKKCFDKLLEKKTTDHGLVYWHYPAPLPENNGYYVQPLTYDVETTSYVLLIMSLRKEAESVYLPTVRWIVSQRNSLGGYSNSQDTQIGIQALATVAPQLTSGSSNVKIEVAYGGAKPLTYLLTDANRVVVNTNTIPAVNKTIIITATGKGTAYLQVSWQYNVRQITPKDPTYRIDTTVTPGKDGYMIEICPVNLKNETTKMAVLEVRLLSGYVINRDTVPKFGVDNDLKLVEYGNGDTFANFYVYTFSTLKDNKTMCVKFTANLKSPVGNIQPAFIRVYDYYNSNNQGHLFYTSKGPVKPTETTPPKTTPPKATPPKTT